MSDPKKVALFVDVENVYLGLRNMYNRELGPELLLEKAKARGELERACAYADWKELPEGLADKFKPFGFETVQVDRVVHQRELNNKRREVVKDLVPVEMLAGVFATLVEKPEIGTVVIASGDRSLVAAVKIAREKFQKDVYVCAIPGSAAKELETAATALDPIEVPPLAPVDEEGLSRLVPLMEELERRKRYLNFKYIRESVVRHGELKAKTFDDAERLLSDAIACGLVLKQKVEDKYHPGQLFTAYALNRDSALWKKYGNGLPAPIRTEEDDQRDAQAAAAAAASEAAAARAAAEPAGATDGPPELAAALPAPSSGPAPAVPMFTASSGRGERTERDGEAREPREAGGGEPREGGRRGRRGRRGRGGREGGREGGERREAGTGSIEVGVGAGRGGERGGERNDRGGERGGERSDRGGERGDRGGERGERSDRGGERGERSDRGGERGSEPRERGGERGGERGSEPRERGSERGDRGRGRDDRGRDRSSSGRGPDKGRSRPQQGGRGRDNRRFESASRLFRDPTTTPALSDDEIDEERILRARGDMGNRRPD